MADELTARLGRRASVDERDRQPRYAMAAPPTERTFRSWLSPGPAWDQGQTSQCVAYSTNRYLHTHPVVNRPFMTHEALYEECQEHDEWEGSDYDGTSVRAGFKVLKSKQAVDLYTWAFELEPVVRHVLEVGPVVMGTDWTYHMFNTDKDGYVWPTGRIAGGHAYVIPVVNTLRKNPDGTVGAARILNSWGPWGDKQSGRAWIALHALEKLIHGLDHWPGEACTAREIKLP